MSPAHTCIHDVLSNLLPVDAAQRAVAAKVPHVVWADVHHQRAVGPLAAALGEAAMRAKMAAARADERLRAAAGVMSLGVLAQ